MKYQLIDGKTSEVITEVDYSRRHQLRRRQEQMNQQLGHIATSANQLIRLIINNHNHTNREDGMKRSELKNEVLTGIRITPDNWGESYLMINEENACAAVADCFDCTPEEMAEQLESDEMRNGRLSLLHTTK